jgi:hypothetical protein
MEALTYRVGKKNFVFLAGDVVRLKLGASAAAVAKLAIAEVGAGGWAKLTVADGTAVPKQLATWIAESYALVVGAAEPKVKAKKKT